MIDFPMDYAMCQLIIRLIYILLVVILSLFNGFMGPVLATVIGLLFRP